MAKTMIGVMLPGNSTVEFREYPIPEPGWGQVLIKMKASSICGSDIRAIYRAHLGEKDEAYRNVIAGHEPCGQVAKLGPGAKRFKEGDRVVIYHISGCGVCHDCRMGYMLSCSSPLRGAYGWQRDGGHAEYLLAEENSLVALPDELTYLDGALVACGFGTSYEALERMKVSGRDRLLVTGLGPVGLAALMLGKAMGATLAIGADVVEERIELAKKLGLVDVGINSQDHDKALEQIKAATEGKGCEVTIDASGNPAGRFLGIQGTRQWGRFAFVGEGNAVTFEPSRDVIHKQLTLFGAWVTNLAHMEDLVERLGRWKIHPEAIVTHTFPLEKAADAYQLMDSGKCGKVAIVWPD